FFARDGDFSPVVVSCAPRLWFERSANPDQRRRAELWRTPVPSGLYYWCGLRAAREPRTPPTPAPADPPPARPPDRRRAARAVRGRGGRVRVRVARAPARADGPRRLPPAPPRPARRRRRLPGDLPGVGAQGGLGEAGRGAVSLAAPRRLPGRAPRPGRSDPASGAGGAGGRGIPRPRCRPRVGWNGGGGGPRRWPGPRAGAGWPPP